MSISSSCLQNDDSMKNVTCIFVLNKRLKISYQLKLKLNTMKSCFSAKKRLTHIIL